MSVLHLTLSIFISIDSLTTKGKLEKNKLQLKKYEKFIFENARCGTRGKPRRA